MRIIRLEVVTAVVFAIAMSMSLLSCEVEEACDPETDPDCEANADGGTQQDGSTNMDGSAQSLSYAYVLIEDNESTSTTGIELDAVELIKGSQSFYATSVEACSQGPGISGSSNTDCNQALGSPESSSDECTSSDSFFVNLGGQGGSIVVSFEGLTEVETGDTIRVYECGSSSSGNYDEYTVKVGVSTSASDSNFVTCGSIGNGTSECTVPSLPIVPVN